MANVCVIGAGVAGLTAAYRLRQAGHQVTVLEAKSCAGGLSTTARDGSVVTEVHDGEPVTQTARLPEGAYINLGPGRLPHHHRRMLRLCRELGVPLEPYIMSSDANFYADSRTGRRFRRRRLDSDVRGHVAEFAYPMCADDEEAALLRAFGDLSDSGEYHGTDRAGWDEKVVPFEDIAAMRPQDNLFFQPSAHFWQDTLFQPVGGMDQIWRALLATGIGPLVQYNAPVTRITTSSRRVRVTWSWGGHSNSRWFDWCLSSIPLPLLSETKLSGFSRDYRRAIDTPEFAPACKVGWLATQRFWEDEEIYGGISYTDHPIRQFWYPSSGHFSGQPGTLTGAYNSYETADEFGRMSVPERIAVAREGGELLHDEMADPEIVPDENAVTVAWARVPFQAGGWCDWNPHDNRHRDAFAALQEPDGRFVVVGDQVSQWPGWQEGAVATAERAVAFVAGDAAPCGAGAPATAVPNSRWLSGGDT